MMSLWTLFTNIIMLNSWVHKQVDGDVVEGSHVQDDGDCNVDAKLKGYHIRKLILIFLNLKCQVEIDKLT